MIGKNLRYFRILAGLSQDELAKRLGITKMAISNYENDKRDVDSKMLLKIAELGTKVIDCRDLCFSYDGKPVISHFTYNFQRYERVGIVGANGIGKSTFVNHLFLPHKHGYYSKNRHCHNSYRHDNLPRKFPQSARES